MMRCLAYGLLFALCASLAYAQDFDQLFIRPSIDSGVFDNSEITWYSAEDWPTTVPKYVALQAPDAGVTRYTMTMPPEAPPEKYCLYISQTGQWSFEPCKTAKKAFRFGNGIQGDYTAPDDQACGRLRNYEAATASGIRGHWVSMFCTEGFGGDEQGFQFTFQVPEGLAATPDLRLYFYSSSVIGTANFRVKRLCITPDNNETWIDDWDASYTPSHGFSLGENAGYLRILTVTQTGWTPSTDDLCHFSVNITNAGFEIPFLYGELQ